MFIFWILKNIIIIVLFVIAYIYSLRFNLHMFQLNGYKNEEHFNWYKKNVRKQWILIFAFVLGALKLIISTAASYIVLSFMFTEFMNMPLLDYLTYGEGKKLNILTKIDNIIEVFCLITLLLIIFVFKAHKNLNKKKKLVYTARVKRLIATIIIADMIIFAVIFMGALYSSLSGAYLIILSLQPFMCIIANVLNHPMEQAVNDYYINDAKKLLKTLNPDIKIIGVTGSYGKTSVKFYLKELLSVKYSVLATPESYNTPMGVVKTIRSSLKPSHEIFICEMGARHVGDIKEICDIVYPHHGIITSIGPQHLETFFNMENIKNTKFELADSLPDDGMLFLNGDNEYINEKAAEYKNTCFYYADEPKNNEIPANNGMNDNTSYPDNIAAMSDSTDLSDDVKIIDKARKCSATSGYYAKDIKVSQFGTSFSVVTPSGETESFNMRLVGAHNVINVVGAIAAANKLGIALNELVIPVRRIQPVEHRMQLRESGSVTIIDDAYNSNPVGSKAAVETLAMFDGVRILITPGMVELGDKEEEYNYKFGTYAAKCCDYIILVGKKHTEPILKGVLSEGFPERNTRVFEHLEDALNYAYSIKDEGHKYILLENDLPDNY